MTYRNRVIPVLTLSGGYLVKTSKFHKPQYIGDPINAVRIFNEKRVDELVLLDIDASAQKKPINFRLIEEIASEAFMPVGYGGGISTLHDAQTLIQLGLEKVIINSAAVAQPDLIHNISQNLGSQSTVVSIDVKKKFTGYEVFTHSGRKKTRLNPLDWAQEVERLGAGELILTSIDRESTFSGYDLDIVGTVAQGVNIPVIALGGAKTGDDLRAAISSGASAAAAGSMFVLNGPHRAVLITYPKLF